MRMRASQNTLDSHRLVLWAADIGKASEMKTAADRVYFSEGGDLADLVVLVQAAPGVSALDAEKVRAARQRCRCRSDVHGGGPTPRNSGIIGVPFSFSVANTLSGAQEP